MESVILSKEHLLVLGQPRSQGLSFCYLGETLAAAGHVAPRFWELNLIVTARAERGGKGACL